MFRLALATNYSSHRTAANTVFRPIVRASARSRPGRRTCVCVCVCVCVRACVCDTQREEEHLKRRTLGLGLGLQLYGQG